MATITRIAELAGVSIATVSRVVSGKGYVSDASCRKVQQAISELDYQPNKIASSLRQQESRIVGILQPDHRTYFNSSFADAVEERLYGDGYLTIVSNTMGKSDLLEKKVDHLLDMRVAGLLVRPGARSMDLPALKKRLRWLDVAVVFVETFPNSPDQFHVQIDNRTGVTQAIRHLTGHGHRQIGVLVPSSARHVNNSHCVRLQELKHVVDEQSDDVQLQVVQQDCANRFEFGQREARQLLRRFPKVTALIGLTDLVAAGALQGIRDLGLSVPDDISLVGYDDSYVARSMHPRLTSVQQPVEALGSAAGAMLIERINDANLPPRTLTISTSISIRESTGPCRPR